MITCVVEYVIDPKKIEAFEHFGRRWMELVNATVVSITATSYRLKVQATKP